MSDPNANAVDLAAINFSAVEDACAVKILSATRPLPPPPDPLPDDYVAPTPRAIVNKCDTYRGEKDEVFFAIVRESAPAIWMHLNKSLNAPKEFEQAGALGQPYTVGTTQNRLTLVWSFLVCAQSLRATRELSHGGLGVYGAYQLLSLLLGMPGSTPATPGRLRGWSPLANFEPFILVGWELLGQTTTAAVYDVQFRTRTQL